MGLVRPDYVEHRPSKHQCNSLLRVITRHSAFTNIGDVILYRVLMALNGSDETLTERFLSQGTFSHQLTSLCLIYKYYITAVSCCGW